MKIVGGARSEGRSLALQFHRLKSIENNLKLVTSFELTCIATNNR